MTNLADHVATCTRWPEDLPLGCRICDIAEQHVDNCINPRCSECSEIRAALSKPRPRAA